MRDISDFGVAFFIFIFFCGGSTGEWEKNEKEDRARGVWVGSAFIAAEEWRQLEHCPAMTKGQRHVYLFWF